MASVAFIHPFIFRFARGIERYTLNLSAALARQGVRVDILTWRWPQPVAWAELDQQVNIRALPTSPYYAAPLMVPFYISHLWQHSYDMIYIHFADYGEAAALNALYRLGRPQTYSIVFHFPYSQVPYRYETLARSQLVTRTAHLVAVSEFVGREARAFLDKPCTVISHGVDTQTFRPDPSQRNVIRAELGLPPKAPLLLTVAALEERKGVQWVLQALPQMITEIPDIFYLVIGDGAYRLQLETLAHELGVTAQVRFLPARTEVARYYQAADLMVILARGEASSIVSLEAMACETPVVASLHPPFDELISPAWGWQVDETDSHHLAKTIIELLNDPVQRSCLGKAGRTCVLTHHTWDRIAGQYLALLKQN